MPKGKITMKELLIPAGSMEALKYAVLNGADAVYLGGKRFGARAYADNFTDEDLKEALSFAHLYGVKVYVTVNTMIFEREIKSVLVSGGVSANKGLRKKFESLIKIRNIKVHFPKIEYCTDNAAMIGCAAYYELKNRNRLERGTYVLDAISTKSGNKKKYNSNKK